MPETTKEKQTIANLEDYIVKGELLYGYKDEEGNYQKEFVVHEMTGVEEEKMTQAGTRENMGKVITSLIHGCTERIGNLKKEEVLKKPRKGGKDEWTRVIEKLFVGDREFLMLQILRATYGDENLEYATQCDKCGEDIIVQFDYDELEINHPECNPEEITFTLPRGYRDKDGERHKNGKLHLPRGIEQSKFDLEVQNNPNKFKTRLLANCVDELGDAPLFEDTFRKMGKSDRDYLVELLSESTFGPDLTVEVTCANCGHETKAGINPLNFMQGM